MVYIGYFLFTFFFPQFSINVKFGIGFVLLSIYDLICLCSDRNNCIAKTYD